MKKMMSVMLVCMMLFALAACGKSDSSTPVIIQQPGAPSSASVADSVPPEVVLNQAFLTGLEKGPDYPENKRITAIMVNNIASSRPTRGLSEAQMLVEIKVEGGITRFMAIYQDYEKIPMVGSVRSARDQFFQLLLPFWGFYVHDGQSVPQRQFFQDWEYDEFNLDTGRYGASSSDPNNISSIAWRDQGRRNSGFPQEYTEYTAGPNIAEAIKSNNLDDFRAYSTPMFNFVPYTQDPRIPVDGAVSELAITHSSSYITHFAYDASSNLYNMSAWNSSKGRVDETIDENNGNQVGFNNLIVLFAPMTLYADSPLVKVNYMGGAGYYFSQGHYEVLLWEKGGPNQALQLYNFDKSGNPVLINPGTTYLAIVDDEMLPEFDGILKSGKAGEAVAGGQVNTNEKETED